MFFLKNHVEKVKIENIKSNEVYAPVEGEVIPLDEVDDAVFSEKILGDGVAVEPDKGEIYSLKFYRIDPDMKNDISPFFRRNSHYMLCRKHNRNSTFHRRIDFSLIRFHSHSVSKYFFRKHSIIHFV